jgi:hypothetical protein
MQNLVRDMEAGLIEQGITDESERLQIILQRLQDEDSRLSEEALETVASLVESLVEKTEEILVEKSGEGEKNDEL